MSQRAVVKGCQLLFKHVEGFVVCWWLIVLFFNWHHFFGLFFIFSVNTLLLLHPSQSASVLFFCSRVFERLLSRSLSFVLFVYYYLPCSCCLANAFSFLSLVASFEPYHILFSRHQPNSGISHAFCAICCCLSGGAVCPGGALKATL